ncbi:RagB/SusD family nutrient uptake outer membrane protein [Mucilaginibacter sp.]|uniref:RagB/SusD family nutrient uptake outer membrane protein n=1 Tax=Mucilaginibacter sp. TaxID=1882438 RepID=UPI002618E8DB|nr:RagB/SusD family nutrient uptake outer membrane protein [Mucilaginibacter sp.]MDB4922794.1 Susd and RagB outer rane lipoprotein [Mucilaginibacter sp.]
MKTKYLNKTFGIGLACLGLGFTLTQSSCTKNFEKYNTNKYNATDSLLKIDGEGLGTFIIPMQLSVFNSINYNYQVQQNLNADIWSGFMMSGDPFNGGVNNTNYGLVTGWNTAAFDIAYPGIMSNWLQISKRAGATSRDFLAIATILKVEGMHRLTDIYGPVPYSQFGKNALSTPYDSQQNVYKEMFADIDTAIKSLDGYIKANPGVAPFKPYDLIFGGDYKQWLKFANSLKLRLAIRVSMVDPTTAKTEGESAMSNPNGLMTTNADNAFVKAVNGVTFTNPLWSICYEYTDINMGAPMETYLKGFKDPRINAYFVKNSAGAYRGIRQGVQILSTTQYANASRFNMTNTSPIKFMTASEVAFLRAEAALRGWNAGGTPQSFYEQGVTLSFEQAGVALGNYLSDATSVEAPYIDLVSAGNNVNAGSPYLSTITIKWNEADSYQKKLERIITQKWLSLWPDGQEAWSEFRRTNYPVLMPVVTNNSGGTIDSKIQVRRLPFPQDEFTNNKAEVTKAISLLGGPDNGGTRLWWDLATKN